MNKPVKHGVITQFCSLESVTKENHESIINYHAQLHFEFCDTSINVLYFNMEGSDNSNSISYLTSLNPKPDLLIFQKLIQTNINVNI